MGKGKLHYRFGRPGHLELQISSASDWSNVALGSVVGGGHGYQDHIRFTRGMTHYVVFTGEMGQLAERPGHRYSGIAILRGERGEKELGTMECKTPAAIAQQWDRKANGVVGGRQGEGPGYEEPDGPFDKWY